jgi:hypothetical protein
LIVIRDVNVPEDRVIHFFGEQVKLRMSVAEQHIMAPFSAEGVPRAFRIGGDPVSVPWTVPGDDFVAGPDADFSCAYWANA